MKLTGAAIDIGKIVIANVNWEKLVHRMIVQDIHITLVPIMRYVSHVLRAVEIMQKNTSL